MVLCGQGNNELAGGYKHAFYRYYAYLLTLGKWQKFVNGFPAYLQDKSLSGAIGKISKLALLFYLMNRSFTSYKHPRR